MAIGNLFISEPTAPYSLPEQISFFYIPRGQMMSCVEPPS
jgi:hypothetical protein